MYYDDQDLESLDVFSERDIDSKNRSKEKTKESLKSLNEENSSYVGLSVIGTLLIQLITFVAIVVTNIIFIGMRPRGNYVQLIDGKVIEAGQFDSQYRSPQTIRRFVFESLSLLFNWNGYKPVSTLEESRNPELDPGVNTERGVVPTTAFLGSFAFREGLRTSLLNEIVKFVPPQVIAGKPNSGRSRGETVAPPAPKIQTFIVIDFISEPQPISKSEWEVNVVSTVLEVSQGGIGREIMKFNKRLVIAAVEPLSPVKVQDLGYFQPFVNIRASGLQITEIKDLNL
jgi:hypothetical protein